MLACTFRVYFWWDRFNFISSPRILLHKRNVWECRAWKREAVFIEFIMKRRFPHEEKWGWRGKCKKPWCNGGGRVDLIIFLWGLCLWKRFWLVKIIFLRGVKKAWQWWGYQDKARWGVGFHVLQCKWDEFKFANSVAADEVEVELEMKRMFYS